MEENMNQPKSGSRTPKIAVITIAIALIIGIGAFIFIRGGFGLSAKETFLTVEYKSIKDSIASDKGDLLINELYQYILTNSYGSTTDIQLSFDATQDGVSMPEVKMVSDILSKLSLQLENKKDLDKNVGFSAIRLLKDDTRVISINTVSTEDALILQVPELVKDYYGISYADFSKLYQDQFGIDLNFNVANMNDTVANFKQDAFDLETSKKTLKQINKNYKDFLLDFFQDEDFTWEKKATTTVANENVATNKLILSLDEARTKELLLATFKYLENNDLMLTSLSNDFATILTFYEKLYGKDFVFGKQGMDFGSIPGLDKSWTKESLKSLFNDLFIKATQGAETLDFSKGLNMTLCLDKKNNLINQQLELGIVDPTSDSKESLHIAGTFTSYQIKTSKVEKSLSLSMGKKETKLQLEFSNIRDLSVKNKETGTITASLVAESPYYDNVDAKLTMATSQDMSSDLLKGNMDYDGKFTIAGESVGAKGSFGYEYGSQKKKSDIKIDLTLGIYANDKKLFNTQGNMNLTYEGSVKDKAVTKDMALNAKFDAPDMGVLELGLTSKTAYVLNPPKIEAIDDYVNISELDENQQTQHIMNFYFSGLSYLDQNKNLLEEIGLGSLLQ